MSDKNVKQKIENEKTPVGVFVQTITKAMTELERRQSRERAIRGLREKTKRGYWVSRPPFGYKVENHRLVVDDKQAAQVRKAYRFFSQTDVTVPKLLNGLDCEVRRNALYHILSNDVYQGECSRFGIKIKTPVIVSRELFRQTQRKLNRSVNASRGVKKVGEYNLSFSDAKAGKCQKCSD